MWYLISAAAIVGAYIAVKPFAVSTYRVQFSDGYHFNQRMMRITAFAKWLNLRVSRGRGCTVKRLRVRVVKRAEFR